MRDAVPAVVGAMLLAGCATAGYPALRTADPQAAWEDGQTAYLRWNAARPGWRTTASGLEYRRGTTAKPKAPQPAPGCTVTIGYEGRLINGDLFDSSYARGEPATLPLNRL